MSGVLVPTGDEKFFPKELIDGDGGADIQIQEVQHESKPQNKTHTHSIFGDLFIKLTSVFAVDLQLSGLCIYWIGVLNSILEQSKIATRRNSISSPLQGSGNDPKGSEDSTKVDIESVSIGTKEFVKTMKSVMHSGGDEASRKEEAAWKKKEKFVFAQCCGLLPLFIFFCIEIFGVTFEQFDSNVRTWAHVCVWGWLFELVMLCIQISSEECQ